MPNYDYEKKQLADYNASGKVVINPANIERLNRNQGQKVLHERAVLCPCRLETNVAQASCQRCYGTGVYYLPFEEDVASLQAMSSDKSLGSLAVQTPGSALASVYNYSMYNYRDRITLDNSVIKESVMYRIAKKDVTHGIFLKYLIVDVDLAILGNPQTNNITDVTGTVNVDKETSIFYPTQDMVGCNVSFNLVVKPRYYVVDFLRQNRGNVNGDSESSRDNVTQNHRSLPSQLLLRREDMILPDINLATNDGKVTVTEIKREDSKPVVTKVTGKYDDSAGDI